jgi:hypothetical protein
MKWKFRHKKWILIALATIGLVLISFFVTLRLDFGQRENEVLRYFSQEEGMPDVFSELEQLTLNDSIILCWWDYGRAVEQWSHREVIEAYPSRDIWNSMASSRDPLVALETQIFGTWGSSEKIHDLARIFLLPEPQSLQIIHAYRASYALVFTPDDLQKFNWIANIAGYDGTLYLTANGSDYKPTTIGSQVTMLRLLFDETLHPTYFTKLFDNSRGKIYRINYP